MAISRNNGGKLMQFELSTGYKIWITKLGKNKKYSLLLSREPNSNEFLKIGLIDDKASLNLLCKAFNKKEHQEVDLNDKLC